MTEAETESQTSGVDQPSVEQQNIDNQSSEASENAVESQEQNQPEAESTKSKPDPDLARERYKESNERRKRELEELRRKYSEQEKRLAQVEAEKARYQHVISSPPKEGEVYDDYLGAYIPDNISIQEYKELRAHKDRLDQEERYKQAAEEYRASIHSGLQENLEAAKRKNPDVENILHEASQEGLIDLSIVMAVADKTSGFNEDGFLFLAGLAKDNPNALREIMTKCRTDAAKAAAIGKLSAKYFEKPAPRMSKNPPPMELLNEKGLKNPNTISMENTDEGYRQRKARHFEALKKR